MATAACDIAHSVLAAVGGKENVVANSTCMTRLRITVADSALIDVDGINALDSVLGCVERGVNGIEVVFGPLSIGPVYSEFAQLTGLSSGIEPLIGSRRPNSRFNVHISPRTAGSAAETPALAGQEEASPDDAAILGELTSLLDES